MNDPQTLSDPAAVISAARGGDPKAQFQLAVNALKRGEENEFRHWVQQAASQDFPPALFRLGSWRLSRALSLPEVSEAKELVCKAADLGFLNAVRAMMNLSAHGAGQLPDWQEGLSWFKKSVEMNDMRALREAGLLLMEDQQNLAIPKALLVHAAAAGDGLACYHLGVVLKDSDNARDRQEAGFWLSHALQGGHPLARKALMALKSVEIIGPDGNLPSLSWPDIEERLSSLREPLEANIGEEVLEDPQARRIPDVLQPWECEYLIGRAAPRLKPATTSESLDQGEQVRR